ncbi:MAG: hypothetical protein QXP31_10450 [Pyrobaculum sp.]
MELEEWKEIVAQLKMGIIPKRNLAELRDLGLIKVERGGIIINRQAVELAWRILSQF